MKKIKYHKLVKIALIFLNILLFLLIIKECQIVGFCITLVSLISPLFFGYIIAWLLKPIMLYLNKHFNIYLSTTLTYIIIALIVLILSYYVIPVIIMEIKNIIPAVLSFYYNLPKEIVSKIDINIIGKAIKLLNNYTNNLKNILFTTFYSFFISFFFLTNHLKVSKVIGHYLPNKLTIKISTDLKAFVLGTFIDTIILFFMTLISLYIVHMPYALLFSIIISITNIIPFIGPYIGGIPAILVGLSVNLNKGIIILVIVLLLQFIESTFIHPMIMSKSLKLNPITIIMGLIVFGYFFGIMGMLISTPLISIIKTIYVYYKKNIHNFNMKVLGK